MQQIYIKNRQEWREWLEIYSKTATEIFLVYFKKATGKPSLTYEESVEEALCFGWIDGMRKGIDGESYMMRFTPRKRGSMWSLVNKERVERLLQGGLMKEAGMQVMEEAKANGQWDAAYSMKNQQHLPEDLKSALVKNPQAWENFQKFSNSVQFVFIRRVDKIKGEVLRAERIKKAVELCELNLKPNAADGKARI